MMRRPGPRSDGASASSGAQQAQAEHRVDERREHRGADQRRRRSTRACARSRARAS